MRAKRSARPHPATAAASRGAWCPRRSSSCRPRPGSSMRWRAWSATSNAASSISRRFGRAARSTCAGRMARTRSRTGTRSMQVSLGAKTSDLRHAWRVLGPEQRAAAVGSLLLIVSTFGPFSFVEAAEILTAIGVLVLLKRRADGYQFHLPFGDGTAIAAAGAWCAVLILIRLFDRPLGQNLLALACAIVIFGAGMRERAKRPMDDLPPETTPVPRRADAKTDWLEADEERTSRVPGDADWTEPVARDADRTGRLSSAPDRESTRGRDRREPPRR